MPFVHPTENLAVKVGEKFPFKLIDNRQQKLVQNFHLVLGSAYFLDKTLYFVLQTEPLELDSDKLVSAHDWFNIIL